MSAPKIQHIIEAYDGRTSDEVVDYFVLHVDSFPSHVALLANSREGLASFYGPGFNGKTTASGVRFDMNAMVAAHPTYPFGTVVRVTNLTNGRAAELRVLDRGPARGPRAAGVIIDVSYGAAKVLGFIQDGRARVRLEVLQWGD